MTSDERSVPGDPVMRYRQRCPSCLEAQATLLLEEPFDSPAMQHYFADHYEGRASIDCLAGQTYQLLRCSRCALAYQRAVPSDWLLGQLYDRWIPLSERERLRRAYTLNSYRYWAEQVEFLILFLNKPPHAVKVLDFGLGWGEWARMAQAYGCEVTGAELSKERIENAQHFGIPIIGGDELSNHRFDFINTEQVFEHLTEPREILQLLAACLSDRGLIKLSVPNARKTLRRVAGGALFGKLSARAIMPIAPLEHLNCFDHDTLVALAAQCGLRVVRPSFLKLCNGASGWFSLRRAAHLLVRPLYRHFYPKSTFVYFSK